jgi:SPP1 gp7 family putative phage head morphogenesis protein
MSNFLSRILGKNEPAAPPAKRKKSFPNSAMPDPQYRITMSMDNLKAAMDQAVDVYNPNRNELLLLYYQTMKDSHTKSQLEIAINKVASLPFRIWDGDTENEDLKYFFKKPWFDDYIKTFIEAELWGYTLGEFGDMVNGEFKNMKVFQRRWVNPARKEILALPSNQRGVPYADVLNDIFMIEFGDPDDQGTLELITKEVIWKNFARTDWSDFNERFGKPILDIATDTDDQAEVNKRATMAAGFGSNLWIVRDIDDQVNILEAKNVGGNGQNFEKMIRMCNEEISKVINGQSGTSDEKSFVGSAEVGERILNDYTKARVRRMSNHINYTLIPFLNFAGYPLNNATFEFIIEEKNVDTKTTDPEPAQPVNKKKSSPGRFGGLSLSVKHAKNALSLETWLLRYFQGKVTGIDADVWRMNFESLVQGIVEAGLDFAVDYEYFDLANELRSNAAVFAAFKNHTEQNELADLLVDDEGKPRDFNAFKKLAKPITERYNKDWLHTEYKQSQASAQMAVKWEGFQQSADLYPNLRYDAVMDKYTRPAHERMNGTVLPINDPFWSRNYPPNGWNCRCDVTQTDEPATRRPGDFTSDPGFDHNPGKDRKLFSENNGYQKDVDDSQSATINAQANLLLNEYLKK